MVWSRWWGIRPPPPPPAPRYTRGWSVPTASGTSDCARAHTRTHINTLLRTAQHEPTAAHPPLTHVSLYLSLVRSNTEAHPPEKIQAHQARRVLYLEALLECRSLSSSLSLFPPLTASLVPLPLSLPLPLPLSPSLCCTRSARGGGNAGSREFLSLMVVATLATGMRQKCVWLAGGSTHSEESTTGCR